MTAYRPTIRDYQETVAHAFGISTADLLGRSRAPRYAVPRQTLCGLLREVPGMSLPRIGDAIGRDHTTVLHAERRFPDHEANPAHKKKIAAIRAVMKNKEFLRTRRK